MACCPASAATAWMEVLGGSQASVFDRLATYAMQWEAVPARWARDDHALLQPAGASWHTAAVYCNTIMKGKTAKRELELCAAPTIL